MTHLTFHKVLVTAVQFAEGDGRAHDDSRRRRGRPTRTTDAEPAPSNQVLVTLALSSPQVEQVVFAAEFGHIWLTAENADADETGTRIVTLGEATSRRWRDDRRPRHREPRAGRPGPVR